MVAGEGFEPPTSGYEPDVPPCAEVPARDSGSLLLEIRSLQRSSLKTI